MNKSIFIKMGFIISVVALLGSCASTEVAGRKQTVTEQLAWPVNVWIYDFAATPSDVPFESWFAGRYVEHNSPQSAGQIAAGRKLGSDISTQLVKEIRSMGLLAQRTWPSMGIIPQNYDIVIRGYILFEQESEASRRFAIGLDSGKSELYTAVESYQMTAQGLRRLGPGMGYSESSRSPGAAVGVASLLEPHNPAGLIVTRGLRVYDDETGTSDVEGWSKHIAREISDILKEQFRQQGWIK